MAHTSNISALLLLVCAVCFSTARQTPGYLITGPMAASSSGSHQQRSLLADNRAHHSSKQHHPTAAHRQARITQLTDDVSDVPPFVGADVPRGRTTPPNSPPAFNGGGSFNAGGGSFSAGGTPNWYNIAQGTVTAVDYGVNVGTRLLAPIVNGVASNIPVLAPALPDGRCLRGSPLFLPRLNVVTCVIGNGAAVTNYLFNAANALVGATGQGLNLAGQIASFRGK